MTDEERDGIKDLNRQTQENARMLDELLLCIKGSSAMEIDGLMGRLRKTEKELRIIKKQHAEFMVEISLNHKKISDKIDGFERFLRSLVGKPAKRIYLLIVAAVILLYVATKNGFEAARDMILDLIKKFW